MHVAEKWPRFWEDDMHRKEPAIAASAKKTGVPPIAGTPWDVIQADLSAITKPDVIVISGVSIFSTP
jgi:hypothetical protein